MVRRLARTQYMNRVRADATVFPDLRNPEPLERIGGAFDPVLHTAEVRNAASGRGWYDISNIVIFLWRLRSYPVVSAPASGLDAQRFLFSPYGMPLPLFSMPVPKDPIALATTAQNVGQPLRGSRWPRPPTSSTAPTRASLSRASRPLRSRSAICRMPAAAPGRIARPPGMLRSIRCSDASPSEPRPPHRPSSAITTASLPISAAANYDRLASFRTCSPSSRCPRRKATVQAALDASAGGGAVEIADSGRYAETIAIHPTATGAVVELRAADQMVPFLALGGDLLISGADGAEVSLNGLWIAGGRVRIAAGDTNKLSRLTLRHCTLAPGISRGGDGSPAQPDAPSLVVETGITLAIERCILGGIRVAPGARSRSPTASSMRRAPTASLMPRSTATRAGAPLSISSSTVIGKVHTSQLQLASNSIFVARLAAGDGWLAPVWADPRSAGCARFCYLPPGSRVPRAYRCQPATGAIPTSPSRSLPRCALAIPATASSAGARRA